MLADVMMNKTSIRFGAIFRFGVAIVIMFLVGYQGCRYFCGGQDTFLGVKIGTRVSLRAINSKYTDPRDLMREKCEDARLNAISDNVDWYRFNPKSPMGDFDEYWVAVEKKSGEIVSVYAESKAVLLPDAMSMIKNVKKQLWEEFKDGFDHDDIRDRNGEVIGYVLMKRNYFSDNRINRIQIQLAGCYVSNDLVRSLNPFVKCVLIVGR